jgi:ATP-dependent protease HslVU (ClpYQ) peptidase subunit
VGVRRSLRRREAQLTTIVYRDGIMAADGRVTLGQLVVTDNCQKIKKLSDGALFALTGDDALWENLIEWLEACEPDTAPPQGKDFTAILVDTSGNLTVYEGNTDRFVPWYGEYAAFGSGSDVAYGALEMGATAEQAVAAAIRRNTNTGGTIQVETPGLPEQDQE